MIYAIIVEASIVEMFQAAILPGLLAVAFFVAVIALRVRRNSSLASLGEPMPADERRTAIRRLIPVVVIFGAIILGLGLSACSRPTPAAGVGVFIILVYGFALRFVTGEGLTIPLLGRSLLDTAVTSA